MNVTGLPRNRGVNADWVNDAYLMAGSAQGKGVWLVESDEQNVWWVIVREQGGDFSYEGEITTASLQGEWDTVRLELLSTVPEEWMEGIDVTPFVHDPAPFRDCELEASGRRVVECWSSGDLAGSVRALSRVLDRRAVNEPPSDTEAVKALRDIAAWWMNTTDDGDDDEGMPPELLEALQRIVALDSEAGKVVLITTYLESVSNAIKDARAAISKATGGTK